MLVLSRWSYHSALFEERKRYLSSQRLVSLSSDMGRRGPVPITNEQTHSNYKLYNKTEWSLLLCNSILLFYNDDACHQVEWVASLTSRSSHRRHDWYISGVGVTLLWPTSRLPTSWPPTGNSPLTVDTVARHQKSNASFISYLNRATMFQMSSPACYEDTIYCCLHRQTQRYIPLNYS